MATYDAIKIVFSTPKSVVTKNSQLPKWAKYNCNYLRIPPLNTELGTSGGGGIASDEFPTVYGYQ